MNTFSIGFQEKIFLTTNIFYWVESMGAERGEIWVLGNKNGVFKFYNYYIYSPTIWDQKFKLSYSTDNQPNDNHILATTNRDLFNFSLNTFSIGFQEKIFLTTNIFYWVESMGAERGEIWVLGNKNGVFKFYNYYIYSPTIWDQKFKLLVHEKMS